MGTPSSFDHRPRWHGSGVFTYHKWQYYNQGMWPKLMNYNTHCTLSLTNFCLFDGTCKTYSEKNIMVLSPSNCMLFYPNHMKGYTLLNHCSYYVIDSLALKYHVNMKSLKENLYHKLMHTYQLLHIKESREIHTS